MGFLDYVAPQWALKRATARARLKAVRAYYEGASTKGRNSRWRASNPGPRDETYGDISVLKNRARDLCRNDALARRAVNVISSYTCGNGIMPTIRNARGEKDADLQRIFNDWAKSSLVDPRGKQNFGALQRLIMRTVVKSGECLILKQTPRQAIPGQTVPLQLLTLEGDYLDDTKHDKKQYWQGIEIRQNTPVGYWIYDSNPQDSGSLASSKISSSDVIHVFDEERPGQIRGVTWLAPVIMRLRDLDQYSDAELTRRKVAACFAAFVESTPDLDIDDDTLETFSKIEPGDVEFLAPGQSIKFSNPPTQVDYDPFVNATIRRIAAGLDIPFEHLSMNLADVNFSSARIGQIPFKKMLEGWQQLIVIPQMLDRVWSWFVEAAVVFGGIRQFEGATCEWIPPQIPMLDVEKESEALKNEVRTGTVSISEAIRRQGKDPDAVLNEISEDAAKLDSLGIILDSDPRKTSNNGRLHSDTEFGGN